MKVVRWGLLVLVIVAILSELTFRSILEREVVAAVRARDPNAQDLSASVASPVLYSLAANQSISRVTVSGRHVDLGSLTADRVSAAATGVHVKVRSSIVDQKVEITHIDRMKLTATFTEQEASAVLPRGWSFVFGQGTVTMKGPVTSVTGRFELRPPATVVFVLGSPLPPPFRSAPSLAFPIAPLASCVQSVTLAPGTVTVTCVQDNPPTDFLPHRPQRGPQSLRSRAGRADEK
jgi:hypothetical protein